MTIQQLPYQKEWAIIINCGTHVSTTLSILSVLRYCDIPLVVFNCRLPKDTDNLDYRKLQQLQSYCDANNLGHFELIELPLRYHGDTLDFVFSNLQADQILLVDSDLEVLNITAITAMRQWIENESCFGAGFFHGPYFGFGNGAFPYGFYQERMWIPFTLLKVAPIRKAIQSGCSFNIQRIYNDFPYNSRIGGLIYKYSRKWHIPMGWNPFRKSYLGFRADYVLIDTGAEIYDYLRRQGLFYAGPRTQIHSHYVAHYDGVTRSQLAKAQGTTDSTATQYSDVETIIVDRLKNEYQFELTLLK